MFSQALRLVHVVKSRHVHNHMHFSEAGGRPPVLVNPGDWSSSNCLYPMPHPTIQCPLVLREVLTLQQRNEGGN
eukprot:5449110-Amphidinium_carterae.1